MYHRSIDAIKYFVVFSDSHIFKNYDLKVAILCLSKEIFREHNVEMVRQMIWLMTKMLNHQDPVPTVVNKKNPNSIKISTKFTIKKVEDYSNILKFINTPFNKD